MSALKSFAPARDSVSWAQDAIREFDEIAARFFQGDVTETITETDRKTGESVKKLRLRKGLPNDLNRKATEALVNTRHAFDQATFAAQFLAATKKPTKTIYFPWAQSPRDLTILCWKSGPSISGFGIFSPNMSHTLLRIRMSEVTTLFVRSPPWLTKNTPSAFP